MTSHLVEIMRPDHAVGDCGSNVFAGADSGGMSPAIDGPARRCYFSAPSAPGSCVRPVISSF